LGRDALRKKQQWFAEQNRFSCGKGIVPLAELPPSDVLEAVSSDRECEGSRSRRHLPSNRPNAQQQAVKLPAWLVFVVLTTAIAAVVAAGIAVWQAFW
jgi:hypothetical protein